MDIMSGSQLIKIKQENFRVKIRRESTENMFKQKRQITLQNNFPPQECLNDQNDLIRSIPRDLIQSYKNSDVNAVIMYLDNLSILIRKFAYKAKVCKDSREITQYKLIEDIIEKFFTENQEVIEILLELCEFKTKVKPQEEDSQGFIAFNQGCFFIEPYYFLILTNITYFNNARIITNLADREITSRVYKTLLNKLDKRQFVQNYEKCCQIMDNMLHFYGNLLIDENLTEDQQKDMCYDLLCSNISIHMKQMTVKASPEQKLSYQSTQIVFLRSVLCTHLPDDLTSFQFNVIYFIQLSVSIISENIPVISNYAIVVLDELSNQYEGIISVATKCIWDTLVSRLIEPNIYGHILGIFGNLVTLNGDDITYELINIGLLSVLSDVLSTQQLSLHNLKQTLSILSNMLMATSSELVDTFCKRLVRIIIPNYSLHLDQGEYLQDHAQILITILHRLIKNKAMTIVDHIFVLESEIIENLIVTIKTHPSLLIEFIQMICQYKDQDSLVLMEILIRLQACNSTGAFNIAFNRLPSLLNDQASYYMEEYAELVLSWERIYEQKSQYEMISQINDQQEEVDMD